MPVPYDLFLTLDVRWEKACVKEGRCGVVRSVLQKCQFQTTRGIPPKSRELSPLYIIWDSIQQNHPSG